MVNLNLIVPFSLVGATAVVVGGIYFFYDSPQKQTKTLFKDKFKSALLSTSDNKDDALWNSKWDVLKGLNKVKNSKLSQALKDHNTKSIDDVIRGLMKRGCQEIYDSEFEGEDSESYSDFKNVCSRSVKDKVGGTGLVKSDGKIDEKGTSLSRASVDTLTLELKSIKAKDEADGKIELQKGCDSVSSQPYNGDGTLLTNNATNYCKVSG